MKKIDLLRDLQEIDSTLDQVRRELEDCRARLGDESEVVPLREGLDVARRELQALQSKGRDLDTEIEDRRTKMKSQEKKLYDGSIRNPKELDSLSKEVEIEKAQISKLEDQALANMDALDSATAVEARSAREFGSKEQEWRSEQADLESRCGVLVGQEADLSAKRREAVSRIDPQTLRTYESVRRMRGVAVAAVERGACQGCRISLSSSVIQRARSSPDLVPCQSCGRFLYVP